MGKNGIQKQEALESDQFESQILFTVQNASKLLSFFEP